MSALEVALLVATALALFMPLVRRLSGRLPRWLDFVPTVLVALMLIQIVVDGFHRTQLEGDRNLQGGVVPDIRVPLIKETVYAMFVKGEDIVLERAIEALQER